MEGFRRDCVHSRHSCLSACRLAQERGEVAGTQWVMKAAYVSMSGAKSQREKLGVSTEMANGRAKLYKASRILSIPALAESGSLGCTTLREEPMDFSVCSEVGGIVFSFGEAAL